MKIDMKKDEQKITKNDKNSIVESLDDLIIEGVNITKHAQEGNAIYHSEPSDVDFLRKVHLRYFQWKGSIKKLLNQEHIIKEIDINFFYEADSVPDLYGGLGYGNVKSKESQTLLKNIRVETSKKLKELIKIKDNVLNIKRAKTIKIEKETKLISLINYDEENETMLQIKKFEPISFGGKSRRALINFFYDCRGDGEWKSYEDIAGSANVKYNTSAIRKEIERINKRIAKHTEKQIKEIIERKSKGNYGRTSPYLYRWK